jgi:PRTRC genetic system protein E
MFAELMPLIENRPLTITVAVASARRLIRVNVVPQSLPTDGNVNEKIGYSNKDKIAKVPDAAIKALTTPLSLTGTPEEIDEELAQTLKNFAESHVQLQKTFDRAKEQIAEAVKVKTVATTKQEEDADASKGVLTNRGLFDAAAAASSQDRNLDKDGHSPSGAE